MKVALYQEGDVYCAQDVTKIFTNLELAMEYAPKGFVWRADPLPSLYAEKKAIGNELDRWVTIDEYQVIE